MPIKRGSGESKDKFISRCMSREAGKFPDEKQRYAVCMSYFGDSIDVLSAYTNAANRSVVAEYHGLGPEKASEQPDANPAFWDTYAKAMMVDVTQARRMLCANCEYFNNTTEAMEKMDAVPMDAYDADGGGRGFCEKFDFICHNLRTCRAWEPKEFESDDSSAKLQDSNTHANNSAMTHKFLDRANIGTVRKTSEGYVTAHAKAVRAGVQDYLASELGLTGNRVVRVMRPENEVFSKDSVAGFAHAPVTNDHPRELVDADNWRNLAVGEVGANVMRDGEFLALDLILKDAAAIKDFESGKKELSAGYTAEIEFVDNHPDYDAVMKNIRINHLALVDKARAGSEARIGDGAANQWGAAPLTTSNEVPKVEMKAVAIGDKAINVAATDADALKIAIEAKDKRIGELEGAIAVKDAEIADAKAKILTDEQIKEKAKAMADAMARREKVKAALGDKAADMTDAQIEGALAVIDAGVVANDTARSALGDAMKPKGKEMSPMEAFYAERDKKKGAK